MISKLRFVSALVLFAGGTAATALGACGGSQPAAPSPPAPYPPASAEANASAMVFGTDAAASTSSSSASTASSSSATAPPHAAPEFSYADATGPEHWASLDATFAACAGSHQSPIDLPAKPTTTASAKDGIAHPHFDKFPLKILNNGHTVQVNDSAPSSLQIGTTTYALAQFHFHVPSEHTIAGQRYAGELHFVFKSSDGRLAVIGMLIKAGKLNTLLADVISHAPAEKTPETTIDGTSIDPTNIIPAHATYYRYDGSLTVPPCTEGVTWLVVSPKSGVVELSAPQLAALGKALHAPTSRPVQPRNGRVPVVVDTAAAKAGL